MSRGMSYVVVLCVERPRVGRRTTEVRHSCFRDDHAGVGTGGTNRQPCRLGIRFIIRVRRNAIGRHADRDGSREVDQIVNVRLLEVRE